MEIWRLDAAEPIVQQVLAAQPWEALQRRKLFLLNHVDGEIEDEDGDCANGFILADPIPSPYLGSLYAGACSGRKHKREIEVADRQPEHQIHASDAWFWCNLCNKEVSLESLALASSSGCSCLFCRGCLESVVSSAIKDVLRRNPPQVLDPGPSSKSQSKCPKLMIDLTKDDGDGDDDCSIVGEVASSSSFSSLWDYLPCPSPFCRGKFRLTDIQSVSPDCFAQWEAAASDALVKNSGSFVKCPGCQVVIEKVESDLPPGLALSGVPEFDRTVPFTELDDDGNRLSRRAMVDKAVNRFRCVVCSMDFCAACLQRPYHLGKTCEEFSLEKKALRCIYCDQVCRHEIKSLVGGNDVGSSSVKDIRSRLEQEGVDSGWCVEKSDLVAVERLCDRVCQEMECRQRLKQACTRNLHCGHHCCGVRGERNCLPCLEEECQKQKLSGKALASAEDFCGICLVEVLRSAPSILLQCGHIVHLHCAKRQIQQGCPGPQISFGYLKCPQCKLLMKHSKLDADMHKHLTTMDQIKARAIKRLKLEGVYDKLKASCSSDDKLTSLALEQYQYYMCSKCKNPYYGGKRNCGPNLVEDQGRQYDPSELVCGGCSAGADGKCKLGHGNQFVEFKCRFCCSIATFFCFGTIHFCDSCHGIWPQQHSSSYVLPQCKGPQHCPLGIAHAPNGKEHCLGCSMCRSQEQL
ncbi:uncharacterized protein LOC9631788 [Selaginella moellendorffii]|uniref:uncharacterized protein LOC9631788 n=1 Tax=Selaginella moellendorffii TaxID=88036 RepID=UPI000D1C49C3|nr:uncharacterized protein LOC9631788 [Selaginella moellendorffii]|eukprot:XP_024530918.1 uncharacterized protein LOC9631788 [Selaginella moellendorffii]